MQMYFDVFVGREVISISSSSSILKDSLISSHFLLIVFLKSRMKIKAFFLSFFFFFSHRKCVAIDLLNSLHCLL